MSMALLAIDYAYKKYKERKLEKEICNLKRKVEFTLRKLEDILDETKLCQNFEIKNELFYLEDEISSIIVGNKIEEKEEQLLSLEFTFLDLNDLINDVCALKEKRLNVGFSDETFLNKIRTIRNNVLTKRFQEYEKVKGYLFNVYLKIRDHPPEYIQNRILKNNKKWKVKIDLKNTRVEGRYKRKFYLICEFKKGILKIDELTKQKQKEIHCFVFPYVSDTIKNFVKGRNIFIYDLSENELIYNKGDVVADYFAPYFSELPFKSIYSVIKENAEDGIVSRDFLENKLKLSQKSIKHLEKKMFFPYKGNYLLRG